MTDKESDSQSNEHTDRTANRSTEGWNGRTFFIQNRHKFGHTVDCGHPQCKGWKPDTDRRLWGERRQADCD